MKVTIVLAVVMQVAVWVGLAWLGGSVLTSGVKAVTKSCDVQYGIEPVVSGHWFCPKGSR